MNSSFHFRFLFLFSIVQTYLFSQVDNEIITFKGVKFTTKKGNGIINSFGSCSFVYPSAGSSIPFWIAFGDTSTNEVDTTFGNNNFLIISKVKGPGEIIGIPEKPSAKFCYFNNLQFTKPGYYIIHLRISGTYKYEKTIQITVIKDSDLFAKSPSGKSGNGKGNKVFAKAHCTTIIPVDAVFPIIVAIIDSVTGNIDSTYSGTIYVSKDYGPGEVYGTLSMSGGKWFNFNDVHFSADGYYSIKLFDSDTAKYKSATMQVLVTSPNHSIEVDINAIIAYPNPFIDIINVSLSESHEQLTYHILDGSARVVFRNENMNIEGTLRIDAQNIQSGFYILSIKSSDGHTLRNIPIIKK